MRHENNRVQEESSLSEICKELRGFLNFTALDARRTDADTLGRSGDHGVDRLQVQIPAPLGNVVGVADTVSEPRAALTDFTHFRHG
jgi:hypothetical protein